jgi:uncharacterized membrane protein (DUF485 family)
VSTTQHRPAGAHYQRVQASPEFCALRGRLRRFVFPMSALFLLWYLAYVLLASYARPFMATKLTGNITVGLVLGLLQFASTFVITTIYVRYAGRSIDPAAAAIREQMERSGVSERASSPSDTAARPTPSTSVSEASA